MTEQGKTHRITKCLANALREVDRALRYRLPVTVHVFAITDEKILLLQRQNTGYADGQYSVIAGHVERGETVYQAAVREAKEEAGISMEAKDLEVVGVMQRLFPVQGTARIDFFLRAAKWQGEPYNAEPEKCAELRWYKLHELPANTVGYVKTSIENHLKGQWFDIYVELPQN